MCENGGDEGKKDTMVGNVVTVGGRHVVVSGVGVVSTGGVGGRGTRGRGCVVVA